jgi:hypothetical protein
MGFAADCPLVLLVEPESRIAGIAHAGWRPLTAEILHNTIDAMKSLGAQPGRIVAGIAPSIGPCCYEVGSEVKSAAEQSIAGAGEFFRRTLSETQNSKLEGQQLKQQEKQHGPATGGDFQIFDFRPSDCRWMLDLWGLCVRALQVAGVPPSNVEVSGLCSRCRQDLFFSHRGSGGRTGRYAAIVGYR